MSDLAATNCGGCGGCGDNCNSIVWIIILLLLFDGNNGCGCNNGCGNGCNSFWIIILLFLCCGCGNGRNFAPRGKISPAPDDDRTSEHGYKAIQGRDGGGARTSRGTQRTAVSRYLQVRLHPQVSRAHFQCEYQGFQAVP